MNENEENGADAHTGPGLANTMNGPTNDGLDDSSGGGKPSERASSDGRQPNEDKPSTHAIGTPASAEKEGQKERVNGDGLANRDDHKNSAEVYWETKLHGWTLEPFPDLSGLRARAKGSERGSATVKVEQGVFPSALAFQAAWAFLLYMYAEAETPDIVFGVERGARRLTSEEAMGTNEVVLSKFAADEKESSAFPAADAVNKLGFDSAIYFQAGDDEQLAVRVEIKAESNELRATFSPQVLTQPAAECVLQQLADVAVYIEANPTGTFLDNASAIREDLQAALNANPQLIPTPDGELLHSAFERNARERPDRLALWFHAEDGSEVKWTYGELDKKASVLAKAIQDAAGATGIVDAAVPLCMEKTPELYVAILGVLKAGGAWCPIDPAFPALRKQDLLTRAGGPVVLVGTAAERDALVADNALPTDRAVTVLAVADIIAQETDKPVVECGARPSTLAYLIWTSGTTGAPKGVPIEHSAAVQAIAALHRDIPYAADDDVRCIQFSAFTFDVSVQDFFYTWGAPCGTLCSASRPLLLGQFPEQCNAFEITHAFLTPAFMATTSLAACKTIKTLTSIGEKLPDAVADQWCAPGVVSVNTYGPAESTIVSTVRTWTPGEGVKAHNVGRPLSTISCFAVKDHRVLPRGAAGELAIGGFQNARGYLSQPDKTAAKFVAHARAGRVYLTGDVVRILHDGTIEFVGRTDDLVKLGGVRVELSEISALIAPPAPGGAWGPVATLQLSRPDRPQKVICSFVACKALAGESTVSEAAAKVASEAKERAMATLPSYMVPNVFLVVPRIPTTPSNKIDRTALARVYADVDLAAWESLLAQNALHGGDAPENEKEKEAVEAIRHAVAKLTGAPLEVVGVDTPLNALGVDSIRAIQLAASIRSLGLGRDVAVLDVLEHPTARLLAAFVASDPAGGDGAEAREIHQALETFNAQWLPRVRQQLKGKIGDDQVQTAFPCLPLQEGMLSERALHHRAYWSHSCLDLDAGVDADKLRDAWGALAKEYDMLRTGFVQPTGDYSDDVTFIQVLYATPHVDWAELKMGDAASLKDFASARAEQVMKDAANSVRPPWALSLLINADGQRMLMLSAHHSIYDADTLRILLEDAVAAYHGHTLPPRPTLFSVVASLRTTAPDARQFWTAALQPFADSEPHGLPDLTGRTRPKGSKAPGHISHRQPTTSSREELEAAGRALGGSLGHLAQAAWAVVLGAYTEAQRVVFGETLSARRDARALGPLLSVSPVPLDVGELATARTAVAALVKLAEESVGRRGVPVSVYREALMRGKDKSAWDAMFVLHPETEEDDDGEAALWRLVPNVVPLYVEHGWALNVELHKGHVELDIWADSALISPTQLALLTEQTDAVLALLAKHPDVAFGTLLSQLPLQFLSYSAPTPPPSIIDAPNRHPTWWLERYAREHPDWTAAIVASRIEEDGADTTSWTYKELDDAANRVAHFILAKGIRRRTVAFCVGRTLPAYAYQLGIFKTGNCYLPVEEDLPAARKVLLVHDSDAALVFTTAEQAVHFQDVKDGVEIVVVDQQAHRAELARQPTTVPVVEYDRYAPGYLLYTSGSTGLPKGVLVSHGNLVSFIECLYELINKHCPVPPFAGKGRFLGRTSIAFDVHLLEIFAAFRFGMATASAPRHIILADLGNTLRHLKITHSCLVPSLLERSGLVPADVPNLRWASVGGEKISARIIEVWGNDPGGIVLFNAYGPTEVTIGCSMARVTRTSSARDIGRIFDGNQAHVFRPGTQQLTLRGQPGELCVSGDLVGIGYLNRPDAKGFVTTEGGTVLYRTGDMVRLLADETIEYLGRSDDQTKIRGQRLELAEVSECLRAASDENLAVASLVAKHPSLNRDLLLSFLSRVTRAQKDATDVPSVLYTEAGLCQRLLAACRDRLPAFMVPDLIISVDFMPVALISRKVDSKLLRKVFSDTPLDALLGDATPPTRALTSDEERVRDVILSMASSVSEPITHRTTTLQLGLDSIGAIRLAARLDAAGLPVPVAFLVRGPSIEAIASRATMGSGGDQAVSLHRVEELRLFARRARAALGASHDIQDVLPALPLQESLVARSLDSDMPLYVNHVLLQLQPHRLEAILHHLSEAICANDIFRTCFVTVDGKVAQVILPAGSYPDPVTRRAVKSSLPVLDLIADSLVAIARDVIDKISSVPPLRVNLWRREDEAHLVISMHHSIYDGQYILVIGESLVLFLREIELRLLTQFTLQRTPFSAIVNYVNTRNLDDARRFYEDYLRNVSPQPALPTVSDPMQFATVEVVHDINLRDLETTARNASFGLHPLCQAAFAVALGERLHCQDILIGVVLSGRTIPIPGADTVLAPCITTVPVRVNFASNGDFADVVAAVQSDSEHILTHQHTPLQLIQKWSGNYGALFNALFTFTRSDGLNLNPEVWRELPGTYGIDYPFALEVIASEDENSLKLSAVFTGEFDASVAASVVHRTATLISNISTPLAVAKIAPSPHRPAVQYDETSWNDTESQIRACVAEICDVPLDTVTKNVAFLRLGLDSISAIRMAQRLRSLGIGVRSADILRFPSIGTLAEHIITTKLQHQRQDDSVLRFSGIREKLSQEYVGRIPTLTKLDRIEQVVPATALQAALLTSTLASGGKLYVVSHPLQLARTADIARLRTSWERLVRAGEILRTSFHQGIDIPWISAVHTDIPIRWVETTCSDAELVEFLESTTSATSFYSADAFSAPPHHVHIVSTPSRVVLLLVMHHALYDGTSLEFLLQDLALLYAGHPIPERPQFSLALPYLLHRPQDEADFWQRRLAGYTPVRLHSNVPQAPAALYECASTINTGKIEAACKTMEVTVQAVALLAWAKVYASLANSRDVVFGHVISGRSIPLEGALSVAGPLFNTIPVRVTFASESDTNAEAVKTLHLAHALAEPYQHTPLRDIQNAWRGTSNAALLDALFVFQRTEQLLERPAESLWAPFRSETELYEPEYALNAEVEYGTNSLKLRLGCRAGAFEPSRARELLQAFNAALTEIVQEPNSPALRVPSPLAPLPASLPPASSDKPSPASAPAGDNEVFSPDEQALREAVCAVARIPLNRLRPRTPFYTVGVDSISVLQIVARTRRGFAIGDLLTGMHVRGAIAARDARLRKTEGDGDIVPSELQATVLTHLGLNADQVEYVLPVLPGQRHHVAAWLATGRTFYELPFAYRSPKPLDKEKLSVAWNSLRARHAVLRTVFAATSSSQLLQVVLRPSNADTTYGFVESDEDLGTAVKKQMTETMHAPSDMYAPPVRAFHVRAKDGQDAFVLVIHHALYDGWSLPLLIADLCTLYGNRSAALEPAPSFPGLVKHIVSRPNSASQAFWAEYMRDAGPTRLAATPSAERDAFLFAQNVLPAAGLTPALLLRALARALPFDKDNEDAEAVVGLFQAGRSTPFADIERVAGPTLALLPLRIGVGRDIEADLATRAPHEQYDGTKEWEGLFNVYVNVLWHADRLWDDDAKMAGVLERMDVGDATDYAAHAPIPGRTAVDMLDISDIPKESVSIDLALNPRTGGVDVGVRCEGLLLGVPDIQRLVDAFVRNVRAMV
ncbi:acetyl-CoA synthetase-like protein [Auricularia subglabra TFB-10046 SS5]|uniref:Acetyl-CoA synthetase-like protein n=1 Tax=Auricularia subglabra (strain TFB-10046 / SS5) TaxID=717982 RepID=J0CXZ9_AURST|nr:acetyl-CoA synthetase-like protein [Auricularia subglabra TFB-10046 SS5]